MGGGGSKRYVAKPQADVPSRDDAAQKALGYSVEQDSMEKSVNLSVNINAMRYNDLDNESRDLLVEAFGDLFMLDGEDHTSLKIRLLLQACTRESSPADVTLMREGEIGHKLYVVQSGHLSVSIEGDVVRHLTTGALFGEISLLYNAPRSATVTCLTPCTLFVLTREAFRQVQGLASSASLLRRSRWLQAAAEVLSLGTVDISRLAGTLETQNFVKGDKLYTENENSNKIFLIEEGGASVYTSDGTLHNLTAEEIRKSCGILVPSKSRETVLNEKGLQKLPELQRDETFSPRQVVEAMVDEVEPGKVLSKQYHVENEGMATTIFKGCIIGIGLINPIADVKDIFYLKPNKRVGAKMPFSVEVQSDKLQCSYFSIDTFTHMFGAINPKVRIGIGSPNGSVGFSSANRFMNNLMDENIRSLGSSASSAADGDINRMQFLSHETCLRQVYKPKIVNIDSIDEDCTVRSGEESPLHRPNRGGSRLDEKDKAGKVIRYVDESFRELCLLGKGAYGSVALATDILSGQYYAVKRIHKANARSSQHIRHIFDECKLLLQMKRCPFILSLCGLYMTADDVVLVLEPALYGDLWGVIYETKRHSRGLPVDLIKFYCASIVLGLAHIHRRGIAFRDLKPENIMINERGYLSIIDFGFAKKIPFLHVDDAGVKLVKMKSYTLCGTPDYLAPEFIFNTGVNHAVDIWALGVIIHEMIMLNTPFRPPRKNDLTALFVNIASVKKIGLKLSSNLDYRTGDAKAYQLIAQLLRADPNDRLGALDSTAKILDAAFFDDFPCSVLKKQEMIAPFIPEKFVDLNKFKSESKAARYVREKKPYAAHDAELSSQWEAFNALILQNTVPIGEIK